MKTSQLYSEHFIFQAYSHDFKPEFYQGSSWKIDLKDLLAYQSFCAVYLVL